MAQLMPLPLTVSCFSEIHIGFTFLVLAHLGSPGKKAVIRVCVGGDCIGISEDFLAFIYSLSCGGIACVMKCLAILYLWQLDWQQNKRQTENVKKTSKRHVSIAYTSLAQCHAVKILIYSSQLEHTNISPTAVKSETNILINDNACLAWCASMKVMS